jgi:hypothetical protein
LLLDEARFVDALFEKSFFSSRLSNIRRRSDEACLHSGLTLYEEMKSGQLLSAEQTSLQRRQ